MSDWRGSRFCSPVNGKSAGVALFVSDCLDGHIISSKIDTEGRVLGLLINHGDCNLNIVLLTRPITFLSKILFYSLFIAIFLQILT